MFTEIIQLDGRQAARKNTLAQLGESITVGFEVTDPQFAAACAAGNFDPQHLGGRPDLSAIEVTAAMLRGEAHAATSLPDLDSIGSMAVLSIGMEAIAEVRALEGAIVGRIALIGAADRFERGEWPGVRELPSHENPWFENAGASDVRELAAIAAVVQDRGVGLKDRMQLVKRWLQTGEEPAEYRVRVEAERIDMIAAVERGDVAISEQVGGKLVGVESTHRAALGLGYHRAPVVVALNSQFPSRDGGEPQRKFTIAQYKEGYVDIGKVVAGLNVAEATRKGVVVSEMQNRWGGSRTICGSPQGESSVLAMDEVIDMVSEHIA